MPQRQRGAEVKRLKSNFLITLTVYATTSGVGLLLGLFSGQRSNDWTTQTSLCGTLWLKIMFTGLLFSSVFFAGAEFLYKRRHPNEILPLHPWFILMCMWATVGFLHVTPPSQRVCIACISRNIKPSDALPHLSESASFTSPVDGL